MTGTFPDTPAFFVGCAAASGHEAANSPPIGANRAPTAPWANKNSIKIIGDETDFWPQGYFVYDSKKSRALTISHLDTGYWPLYRYDPRRALEGLPPLQLDSGPPKTDIGIYMQSEGRFHAIQQNAPERVAQLTDQARHDQTVRRALYDD